ncbi:MAG: guanylate kinase [Prevotella sp.]|nr:guanylate kinase [Candidatus Equicola faecalis]
MKSGKLLIFAAPSGAGKSTIVNFLMHQGLNCHFSVSTTTRKPRDNEQDGVNYFFISKDDFRHHIIMNEFIEYEEVYAGTFYGTLKSQVEKQLERGENVVFDVDVNGGLAIKKHYGDRALAIFIMPPSKEELTHRLLARGTEAYDVIDERMKRVDYEISQANNFDQVVVNDNLEQAEHKVFELVKAFLDK